MPTPTAPRKTGIPEGFLALPVHDRAGEGPLRVCVLVRRAPDPAAGHLVMLRDLPDARVYLGCVTDAAGRRREWIEIWVQDVDGLEASLPAWREAFANHALDQRWTQRAESLAALDPEGFLWTAWQHQHPLPGFLDLTQHRLVHPGAEDADGPWALCLDDAALSAAGLPAYGQSLHRYLWRSAKGSGGTFVPVTANAPANERTTPPNQAFGAVAGHVPLNPQGGLMLAAALAPIPFEDYVDLLGGKPWRGLELGKKPFGFDGPYEGLDDPSTVTESGHFMLIGNQGRAGRLVETLHLKLQLLTDVFGAVREFIARHQLPFLNLAGDSFRVRLHASGRRLPRFWTARACLVKPPEAFALPIESTEARYFIRPRASSPSIYQPEGLTVGSAGVGTVRLRQVLPPEEGRTVVEGTVVLAETRAFSPRDLFWVRLPLAGKRIDLYGHVYSAESLARGEVRFRTVGQSLPAEVAKALKAAEGVAFPQAPFEVVPLLSSPCDAYALGVLAVRTLLVNRDNALAVALDELLSLARQVAAEPKSDRPLVQRLGAVYANDPRFAGSLGPHRLLFEGAEAAAAQAWVPARLWHEILAWLIALFPGMGPDSRCRDYGDAPPLALETILNAPIEDLERLVVRSRSLVVIDWNANREIQAAIRTFLT